MVVVGLGSPFLSDDSVGPRVIRRLAPLPMPGVRLVEAHAGGLLLLEELSGASGAIIVDALADPRRTPGELLVTGLEGTTRNAACSHDCTLAEAVQMGRLLGMDLPTDDAIHLVGIVAADLTTVGEALTPRVEAALEPACAAVRDILSRMGMGPPPSEEP